MPYYVGNLDTVASAARPRSPGGGLLIGTVTSDPPEDQLRDHGDRPATAIETNSGSQKLPSNVEPKK